MDTDWLLELLGIRPRQAEAKLGPDGTYVQPPEEQEANRNEFMARVEAPEPPPTNDLMDIVRRNQGTGVQPVPEVPGLEPAAAAIHNSALAEQQALADLERQIQREAEIANRNRSMDNREMIIREVQNGIRQRTAQGRSPWFPRVDPFIDAAVSGPGPTPQAPQYASLERVGPPLQNVGTPAPSPGGGRVVGDMVGGRGATAPTPAPAPVNFSAAPPTNPNPAAMDPAMAGYNPIVGATPGGPFMTMPPPDPFMEANPQVGVTPAPIPHPAPSPNYTIPPRAQQRNPNAPFPFTNPSAATRLTMPAAEGGSILDRPPAVPQTDNTSPFAPDGELINWWNLGRGRNQPGQGPTPAASPARPPAPPSPGPDQSTILNQQELARFLASNGGGTPPPPAPAATPTTPLASAPPVAPTPPPPGATTMTPPAPPSPGAQIPPALQEQLLQEAYRMLSRRNQPPVPVP